MKAELERRAQAIASNAGDGMIATSEVGPNRARAEAKTETFEAMRAEATTRDLSRALDAGR